MDAHIHNFDTMVDNWKDFDPYTDELWKDIKGYEGYYQISSLGNVRSLDRVVTYNNGRTAKYKGSMRSPSVSDYRLIALSKDGKVSVKKISRLVAEHFLFKIEGKDIVNHIDGNKKNDCVVNLEWCTLSENSIHAFENNLSSRKNKVSGVFYEQRRDKWAAYLYRNCKNIFIGRFNTQSEAVKAREKYINGKGISKTAKC